MFCVKNILAKWRNCLSWIVDTVTHVNLRKAAYYACDVMSHVGIVWGSSGL